MRFGLGSLVVVALLAAGAWWWHGPLAGVLTGMVAGTAVGLWTARQIWNVRSQVFVRTVFRGAARGDALALTFDDGPDPDYTPQVLDLLAASGDKATFFMVGARAAAHPELVARVHAEGHQIGSHSHDHAVRFHFLGPRAMAAEIRRGIDSVARITGETPAAFRPPIGLRVPTLRDALAHVPLPLVVYTWTERGLDAFRRSAAEIVARLEPALAPGAILALHDGHGLGGSTDRAPTIDALRVLLPRLRERGLRSVRLDQLPT